MPRLFLSPPHLSGAELDLLGEAIESNWITTLGPQVEAFEQELAATTGAPSVLALSSGTAAIHLALIVNGIGAGDEVACSALTFAASANPIVYSGAAPFFVDCDESWLIDPDLLDEAIAARKRAGGRVRAVIAVDLYGRCCDYDAITEVCARHDVILIQDAAESLGATYRGAPLGHAGTARGAVVQRQQDHHDERRRGARGTDDALVAARAQAVDAGTRARAALRAHRDRLQLPPQQPAGRRWPGAAGGAAGARCGPAANQRPLPRAARRCSRHRLHAGRRPTARRTAGSRASRSIPPRSAPTGSRSGWPSRQRTSSHGPCGSRCTCSPCSRAARSTAATSPHDCSSRGSACRAARR